MSGKRALVLVLIGIIVVMMGCTGKKYGDLMDVNNQFIVAMEDYIDATGKATSAKDVAKAINQYADRMEKLAPQMKQLREKYPELNDASATPEELKAIDKRAQELEKKVVGSYMNMMQYMMNSEVQGAMQRLQNAMLKMQ